eukprot:8432851-Pyramimonas_sp.AAC.2
MAARPYKARARPPAAPWFVPPATRASPNQLGSFCEWCPLWVYSLSSSAIGACYEYILFPLLRLVLNLWDRLGRGLAGPVWRAV